MKRRIPRQIVLQNVTITVRQVKDVSRAAERIGVDVSGLPDELCGLAVESKSLILIKSDMSPEAKAQTYRHEVAHFIGWLVGVRLSDPPQVDALASILADVKRGL